MPTLADMQSVDCLGFGKFSEKQCGPMIQMLLRTGRLNSDPPKCRGSGIVIAGGGKYLSWAYAVAKTIRKLGCGLPIQVWHIGPEEMPSWAVRHFIELDADPVDALPILAKKPHRMFTQYVAQRKWTYAGWCLKGFAIEHCPFKDVLYLDADCFPCLNPETLMNDPEIRNSGGLFFSDIANHARSPWAWVYCSLTPPVREWEAGVYFTNKEIGWMGLRWSNWMNEHADTWWAMVHGDKSSLELGTRVSGVPHLVSTECSWEGYGILHKWKGVEVAKHAMAYKRNESPAPSPEIQDLFWEWERLKKG